MTKALLNLPDNIYIKANQALLSIVAEMCEGEFLQIQMKEEDSQLSEYRKSYEKVNFKKTALLFGKSCYIGSLFDTRLNDSQRQAMLTFGEHFGMAFQLIDDTLEITEQLEDHSETRVFDASQGILTLPYLVFAEKVLKLHSKKEFAHFKQEIKSPKTLMRIHEEMKEKHIFDDVNTVILSYLDSAKKSLEGVSSASKNSLLQLADYLGHQIQDIYKA